MQSSAAFLRIGTRGSPLALAQAHMVRARLAAAHGVAEEQIELKVIRTTGDAITDRPLAEVGGKGLFTKEIEEALLAGEIDLAVHSAKDMPTALPDGLTITAVLPREDPRDVFISRQTRSFAEMKAGAVVGTASLRRQAQVRRLRPDLKVVSFRGNVETRLRKLDEGVVDATMLALAGLNRLGLAQAIDVDQTPRAELGERAALGLRDVRPAVAGFGIPHVGVGRRDVVVAAERHGLARVPRFGEPAGKPFVPHQLRLIERRVE